MSVITIAQAKENNLKNINLRIPLKKLVVVVGKSGSGKSSLVYDVLYRTSQGEKVRAEVSGLPKTYSIAQKVCAESGKSLGETNWGLLRDVAKKVKPGELLIVDEPCAGFHHEERLEIVALLRGFVKKGISVIVVEHNKDVIANADYVIEFGPESGSKGGEVIFEGTIDQYRKTNTVTSRYAFTNLAEIVHYERQPNEKVKQMQKYSMSVKGITKNNFKNLFLRVFLAACCVSTAKFFRCSLQVRVVFSGA